MGAVRRSDAADGRDHQRHRRHRGDSNSAFFVDNARFVIFDDLNTWGWIVLLLGAAQFLAAFGIWARTPGVRWFGVACAALNAIAQLLFISAYPFWSLALFTLDIPMIYGLIAPAKRVLA